MIQRAVTSASVLRYDLKILPFEPPIHEGGEAFRDCRRAPWKLVAAVGIPSISNVLQVEMVWYWERG